METFDYKPAVEKYAGQVLTGDVRVHDGRPGPIMPSIFKFQKYGQCGKDVSEIFPNIGTKVDEIAFLHSVWGRSDDHVQSTFEMQTGQLRMGYPSMGCWITYGLGSENANLPGFIVLQDAHGGALGASNNWHVGLPAFNVSRHSIRSRRQSDHRFEAAGRRDCGAAAPPARYACEVEPDARRALCRQFGVGGTYLVL